MRLGRRRFMARWITAGTCTLIVAVAVLLYLFRDETIDNPDLGVITYSYRWGSRTLIQADSNRDGRIDFLARIDSLEYPEEYWEDSDYDGHFDRHVVLEGTTIQLVELDENADGTYERRLVGQEAARFYEQRAARESKLDRFFPLPQEGS